MRYYDTATRNQAVLETATTIIDSDARVESFFKPLPAGYRRAYTVGGLPFNELIPPPTAAELAQQIEDDKPNVVTMRQARLALLQQGLLTTVTGAITTGSDEAMKIEWEYATEVNRNWPSLVALATALNMTSADLDNLFQLASTL